MNNSFRERFLKYFVVFLIFPLAYTIFSTSYRNLHVQILDQFASVFVDGRLSDDRHLKFAFIDIDETAYQAWGAQPVTPRQKLVELLHELEWRAAKAKVVIVDIDTSYSRSSAGCSAHRGGAADDPADRALCDWASRHQGSPPVILARFLEPRPDATKGILLAPQESILDGIVDPGLGRGVDGARPVLSTGVHWATPSVKAGVSDGIIRSWSLWQDVCYEGEPLVMPSVQLLTLLALLDGRGRMIDDVVDGLNAGRPESCDEERTMEAPVTTLADGRKLDLGDGWRSQRLLFSVPWSGRSEVDAPDSGDQPVWRWPQPSVATDDVAIYPATEIADLPPYAFDDRVIVIGASYRQARDLQTTPIGAMPGAMVLINAIRSLHAMGTIKEPATGARDLVTAGVVLSLTLLMVILNPRIASLTASIAITAATLILMMHEPGAGFWIDVALAGALFFLLHAIVDLFQPLAVWILHDRRLLSPDLPCPCAIKQPPAESSHDHQNAV